MTTWAELAASGSGQVCYALSVAGVRCYTTETGWQADSDFDLADHKAWLDPLAIPMIDERINFIEGRLKVKGINLRLVASDTLIGEIKDWRVRGYGRLTSTLTVAGATANLDDTSWAGTSGSAWIGGETVSFAGKTATTLTSLTRALLGTAASEHTYDAASRKRPVVSDGPHSIVGRRAKLIAAVKDVNGTIGASTVLYRGRVGNSIEISPLSWLISIEHISSVLEQEIGQRMPQTDIQQGYWYSGEAGSFSYVRIMELNQTAHTQVVTDVVVDSGMYGSGGLRTNLNAKFLDESASFDLLPHVSWEDGKYHLRVDDTQAKTSLNINVRVGDPLWALGFDSGYYAGVANTASDWEAATEPRLLAVDFFVDAETRPAVKVSEPGNITPGLYAQIPGHGHMLIDSVTDDLVYLRPDTYAHHGGLRNIIVDDDEGAMVLRHVFVFHAYHVGAALRAMLHLDVGQSEPESWCALGSVADDWDWDSLTDALGSVSSVLRRWSDTITKPIKVWDVLGPLFGLLAICPRVIADGKIGFVRLQTPVDTLAESVEVDAEIWAAIEAKEVTARLDDSPLVNVISVKHGYDYRRDDDNAWHDPLEIEWDDGINTLGHVRPMTYQLRGTQDSHGDHADLELTLNSQLASTHYGVFGRMATTVEVPCTWAAKQFLCGDIVKVTHSLAPDLTEGAYGVTERMAIVVARRQSGTGRQGDTLILRIPPPNQGAAIAPCALATSWNEPELKLNFAATNLYSATGISDLSWFVAGDTVVLQEADSTTGASWKVEVVAVGSSAVQISTDMTGSFPSGGVYMVFPAYDDASSDQASYAYVADAQAVPTIGTAGDTADEWTI